MPTSELRSPKGSPASGAARRYLAALRNQSEPISIVSFNPPALETDGTTLNSLTSAVMTKTATNTNTYVQRHKNTSSLKDTSNTEGSQSFVHTNNRANNGTGVPFHSTSSLSTSVGGTAGINTHKRQRPQSFFASLPKPITSMPLENQNKLQQQYLSGVNGDNRSANITTTYPLQTQLEEEEAMQSRNGSTSPSRLRPSRSSLNGGPRDSICEDENPTDDKWTEDQWRIYRSKLFPTNPDQYEHPPPQADQNRNIQENFEKRKIYNASPVMTDVSENPTEITNNLKNNKQNARFWQNPTRNGNVASDDANNLVGETSSESVSDRGRRGHTFGPLHKNISAQKFTFDLCEDTVPRTEEKESTGDKGLVLKPSKNAENIKVEATKIKTWRRRKVTNDTGWIKKMDNPSPPTSTSAPSNNNSNSVEVGPNRTSQLEKQKPIMEQNHEIRSKAVVSPLHHGSNSYSLSRRSSTSCLTECVEENDSNKNVPDSLPQHKALGSQERVSNKDTTEAATGGQTKCQWGKIQLRPVRTDGKEDPKSHVQTSNTHEEGKDGSGSGCRGIAKTVKFNSTGWRLASHDSKQMKEENDHKEKNSDCISIHTNEPLPARSDASAASSEFLSVKSRLRSWNRRKPEGESVDTQDQSQSQLRPQTDYLPFRSSPSASPLRPEPIKPRHSTGWQQASVPNSFLSQLKSRGASGVADTSEPGTKRLQSDDNDVKTHLPTATKTNKVSSRYSVGAPYARKLKADMQQKLELAADNESRENDARKIDASEDINAKENTTKSGFNGRTGSLMDRVNRFSGNHQPSPTSNQPSWRRHIARSSTKNVEHKQNNDALSTGAEQKDNKSTEDDDDRSSPLMTNLRRQLKPTPGVGLHNNSDHAKEQPDDTGNKANEGVRGIRSKFESFSGTCSVSPKPAKTSPKRLEKRVWNSKYGASLVESFAEGGTCDKIRQEKGPTNSEMNEIADITLLKRRGRCKPTPWEPHPGTDNVSVLSKEDERSFNSSTKPDPSNVEESEPKKKCTKITAVYGHGGINSIRSRFEALSCANRSSGHQEGRRACKGEVLEQDETVPEEKNHPRKEETETHHKDNYSSNKLKTGEQSQSPKFGSSEGNARSSPRSTIGKSTAVIADNEEATKVGKQLNVKRFKNLEKVDVKKEQKDQPVNLKNGDSRGVLAADESSSLKGHKIGNVKNSAFQHIQKKIGGGKSFTTSLYPIHSRSVNEDTECKGIEAGHEVEETAPPARETPETAQDTPDPNDIPWEEKAPNDIPWNCNFNEKQPLVTTPKPTVDMTYGVEYLDCSYDDDDCDGVTLSPTPSDVSSLSIPTCIQSIETSVVSESTATSDGDTGTMESATEKQSTTLGPSEASSSQTSEAATPLIASTLGNMKFGLMTSSDTTGPSLSTNHYTDLLGTLPPPIDDPTDCKDLLDDNSFHPKEEAKKSFGSNKQFEDQLNVQPIPKWKNDFFAVDSVKSHPTTESLEATNWVAFPEDSMSSEFHFTKSLKDKNKMNKNIPTESNHQGRKYMQKNHGGDHVKSLPTNNRGFDGESKKSQGLRKSLHSKKYNLDSVQELRKEPFIHRGSNTSSPNSGALLPSEPTLVKTTSNVENEAPEGSNQSDAKKRAKSSAYRRFNIQKVREFRRGRSSTKR